MGNLPRAMILIPENSFPDLRKGPPMVIECWDCEPLRFVDLSMWLPLWDWVPCPPVTVAPVSNPFPVEMTHA